MSWLDPLTQRRLDRFRRHRAGWWSFVALATLTGLALLGPLLVGNRPLAMRIDGQWRFPVFAGHIPAKELGYPGEAEPRYRLLAKQVEADGRGWVLLPPIPFAPDEVSEVMPAVHQDAEGRWCDPRGVIREGRIFTLNADGTRARAWTIVDGRPGGDAKVMSDGVTTARAKFVDGKVVAVWPDSLEQGYLVNAKGEKCGLID